MNNTTEATALKAARGMEKATTVNIGKEIRDELRRQERTASWFARKLSYERSNVYSIFHRDSIDTDLLMRISQILHRDFFSVYSRELAGSSANYFFSTPD